MSNIAKKAREYLQSGISLRDFVMSLAPTPPSPCPPAVIFLDIDGVLNCFESIARTRRDDIFSPEAVKALNFITSATGAKLVISSTWRKVRPDTIQVLQDNGINGEVIGYTPSIEHFANRVYRTVERGEEIQAWLKQYGDPMPKFIIIDDDNDMARLGNHLVMTDSNTGLTMSDAARAILTFR